jgi:hypothetical protein
MTRSRSQDTPPGICIGLRAWEFHNDALAQAVICGEPWSWVTLVDRC